MYTPKKTVQNKGNILDRVPKFESEEYDPVEFDSRMELPDSIEDSGFSDAGADEGPFDSLDIDFAAPVSLEDDMLDSLEVSPTDTTPFEDMPDHLDIGQSNAEPFEEELPDGIDTSEETLDELEGFPDPENLEEIPDSVDSEPVESRIALPTKYEGLLFFYLDGGSGDLYSVYSHPYHLIRAFWREDTTADYENSLQDAVTWLYHQIDRHPHLPESNKCLDNVMNDTASLDDLSLTYLAEMALVLPGTVVGYADDADQLNAILSPIIEGCPTVPEEIFRYTNAHEAEQRIVRVKE